MTSMVDVYYNFLIENFGGITYKGCRILAELIDMYEFNESVVDLMHRYADQSDKFTYSAVERNVRIYIKYIEDHHSKEELDAALRYSFNKRTKHVSASELIPVIRRFITLQIEDE